MILPLDSGTVNSLNEAASPNDVVSGADYDLSTLGETVPDGNRCCWCGTADTTGEQIIERFFRPVKSRSADATGPRVFRLLRPLCGDCVKALGLDWCVDCHEWNAKVMIDPETERCFHCLLKPSQAPDPSVPPDSSVVCLNCAGKGRVGAISSGSSCSFAPARCRVCKGEGRVSPERQAAVTEGERLREERIGLGLSLGEQAARLDIDAQELGRRERGEAQHG